MNRPASRALEHAPVFSWQRTHEGLIYTSGHAAVDVDDYKRVRGTFEDEVRVTLENGDVLIREIADPSQRAEG